MPILFHMGKKLFKQGWGCTAAAASELPQISGFRILDVSEGGKGQLHLSSCQPPSRFAISSPTPAPTSPWEACLQGRDVSLCWRRNPEVWLLAFLPCNSSSRNVPGRQRLNLISLNLEISILCPPSRLFYYAGNLVLGTLEAVAVVFVAKQAGKAPFPCGKFHISLDILGG